MVVNNIKKAAGGQRKVLGTYVRKRHFRSLRRTTTFEFKDCNWAEHESRFVTNRLLVIGRKRV